MDMYLRISCKKPTVMYYYHVIITKVILLIQRVKIKESSRYNHVHSLIILHHIWQYTTLTIRICTRTNNLSTYFPYSATVRTS